MTPMAGPFIVAAVLLGAGGASKVVRPAPTAGALRQMGLPSSPALVRVGAFAELAVAAGALAGAGRVFAALVAVSYVAFAAFVVVALRRGVPLSSCGCFGVADTPPTPLHVAINGAAAAVAGAVALGWADAGGLPDIAAMDGPLLRSTFVVLTGASAWFVYLALTERPAAIRRTLSRLGAGPNPRAAPAGATTPLQRAGSTGFDVAGATPTGEAVRLGVVGTPRSTLLAFLSSGCLTCGGFWDSFAAGDHLIVPGGGRLVVVTKGAESESPSRLRELAPPAFPVVMSTNAWLDYKVPHTPYFVYVDGPTGRILGEGSAATWAQVTALRGEAPAGAGAAHADQEFLQVGIRPGRRSVYPPRREQA